MLNKILKLFKSNENKIREKVEIDYIRCKNCLACYKICKNNVFSLEDNKVVVKNVENCDLCGKCKEVCRYGAIFLNI